jgi:DNA-binding MurR/RpiR family transcriptional regulator
MHKLLVGTIALVTGFSMPAPAASIGRGPRPPQVRDIPDVSRNMEANLEQTQSTEDRSQNRDAADQINNQGSDYRSGQRASASVGALFAVAFARARRREDRP